MSGPLRKLLGPAKARLQHYIKEAEQLISKPIEAGMVEEEELTLEDLIERMNNNVSVIERCNANWTSLLQDLKGEAKVTEEQEHSHVAEGDEGYVEVLLNAGECIGHMRARLKRIEKKLVQRTPLSCPSDPKAAGGSNTGRLQISLPKLQLCQNRVREIREETCFLRYSTTILFINTTEN